ncbi:MAG: hypothetical protein OXM56_05555 [Gammaproteobacteria bacterium]|nr:hypothetical protein [Gammaproteobacteria bacterium]
MTPTASYRRTSSQNFDAENLRAIATVPPTPIAIMTAPTPPAPW